MYITKIKTHFLPYTSNRIAQPGGRGSSAAPAAGVALAEAAGEGEAPGRSAAAGGSSWREGPAPPSTAATLAVPLLRGGGPGGGYITINTYSIVTKPPTAHYTYNFNPMQVN